MVLISAAQTISATNREVFISANKIYRNKASSQHMKTIYDLKSTSYDLIAVKLVYKIFSINPIKKQHA